MFYEDIKSLLSRIDRIQSGTETVQEDEGAMDWSTDKVKEFGDDLIKVSKGQLPSDLLNIDDLEDGWADVDQDSRDQKAETIGGQLISVLIGYLQFNAGQKPSAEDVKDAQEVVNDPEFKKAYHSTESYEPFPEADEMTFEDDDAFYEAFGEIGYPEDEVWEAEYRGRKVPLNKPMRGDVKKFKVYVKDPKSGNIKKVNFGHGGSSARRAGQKTMKIRKSNPKARKSFRARHNCANPGPKTKARYWSCRKW